METAGGVGVLGVGVLGVGVLGVGVVVTGAELLPGVLVRGAGPPPPPPEQAVKARRQADDASRKATIDQFMNIPIFMDGLWKSHPDAFPKHNEMRHSGKIVGVPFTNPDRSQL